MHFNVARIAIGIALCSFAIGRSIPARQIARLSNFEVERGVSSEYGINSRGQGEDSASQHKGDKQRRAFDPLEIGSDLHDPGEGGAGDSVPGSEAEPGEAAPGDQAPVTDPSYANPGSRPSPTDTEFEYPINDMTMDDMNRYDDYFDVKAPDTQNWIFYSGELESGQADKFIEAKNADPNIKAANYRDVYTLDDMSDNLIDHLDKANTWKAWAMSSYKFSLMAKGDVHLLLPRGGNPLHPYPNTAAGPKESTWERFEMYALTTNGQVNTITVYNSDDFSVASVLWKKGQPPLGQPPNFTDSPLGTDSLSSSDGGLSDTDMSMGSPKQGGSPATTA